MRRWHLLFNEQADEEILKQWDLSYNDKQKYADKLAALLKILNNDIKGGVSVKKIQIK